MCQKQQQEQQQETKLCLGLREQSSQSKICKTLNTMVDNGRSKIDKTSGYNGLRHVKKREARFDPSVLLERLKL